VRRFDILKPFLLRQRDASYRDTSERLGMSEGAVKSAIYRMRERFQTIFREEIGQTVVTSREIDTEIRYLLEVLAR
jgi:RNA polymerase sigma-70 factor (ECF subfamily)